MGRAKPKEECLVVVTYRSGRSERKPHKTNTKKYDDLIRDLDAAIQTGAVVRYDVQINAKAEA